ncbi:hypothetical protein CAPTEDRAFT_118585, partial [Capitella teleta]
GSKRDRGRLEIWHDGEWGTVCDDSFSDAEASVFCRSMGKPYAHAEAISAFGGGSGGIHLDNVNCDGVQDWRSCSHDGWGIHNCGHSEDVGLNCH